MTAQTGDAACAAGAAAAAANQPPSPRRDREATPVATVYPLEQAARGRGLGGSDDNDVSGCVGSSSACHDNNSEEVVEDVCVSLPPPPSAMSSKELRKRRRRRQRRQLQLQLLEEQRRRFLEEGGDSDDMRQLFSYSVSYFSWAVSSDEDDDETILTIPTRKLAGTSLCLFVG